MSYETKQYIVTGKAANVRKFPDSSSGAIVTTLIQGDIVEADASGTYTNTRGGSTTVYLPVVWDGVRRWAASGNFKEYNDTPLGVAAVEAPLVYAQAIGCKHVSGSYNWATAMEQRQVNCAVVASRVACLAGLLEDGKLISHKTAVESNITTKKGTISKAMSGYGNLDLDKCSVKWVGKTYANLAAKYKVPGAIYVYDSNVAVCGEDGVIYSCNNGSNQLSNGVYVKDAMTSGYCFTSPILVVILPNN
ncbi:MAG: hypothetical protein LUD83_03200 [Clostridiales bacterium]|nr:hypothetical protein [Clostridiales bacterium]